MEKRHESRGEEDDGRFGMSRLYGTSFCDYWLKEMTSCNGRATIMHSYSTVINIYRASKTQLMRAS